MEKIKPGAEHHTLVLLRPTDSSILLIGTDRLCHKCEVRYHARRQAVKPPSAGHRQRMIGNKSPSANRHPQGQRQQVNVSVVMTVRYSFATRLLHVKHP